MRYLLTLLLTFNFACGEDSVRPIKKDSSLTSEDMGAGDMETDEDMETDGVMEESDLGVDCNLLNCMSEEDREKLINMIQVKTPYQVAGGFDFQVEPFEFADEEG